MKLLLLKSMTVAALSAEYPHQAQAQAQAPRAGGSSLLDF